MSDLISRDKAVAAVLGTSIEYQLIYGKKEPKEGFVRSLIKSIANIPQEPQWIPVSEKLPDALDSVLVTSTGGHVYISYIVHGEFEYGGEVIAWMPLPEPYEVGK